MGCAAPTTTSSGGLARALATLALVAATGCGRIDFEPGATTGLDASVSDADGPPAIDADVPPPCTLANPFGPPIPIDELNSDALADGTLRLLPDELGGYYWSGNQPAQDIYYVSRPTFSAPFTRTPAIGINSAANELDPTLSPDGALMVFRRNGPGDDLYMATRQTADTFGTPVAITTVNSASADTQSFMPIGIDELYFQSLRSGAGDLYRSTRSGTTFSQPTLITELATADEEGDPVVTPDGLAIYFRSDRVAALGGFNIFMATRSTPTGTFGAPSLVPNINTDADDGPSWISPDGCRLYISSDRAGTNDIYVATRPL